MESNTTIIDSDAFVYHGSIALPTKQHRRLLGMAGEELLVILSAFAVLGVVTVIVTPKLINAESDKTVKIECDLTPAQSQVISSVATILTTSKSLIDIQPHSEGRGIETIVLCVNTVNQKSDLRNRDLLFIHHSRMLQSITVYAVSGTKPDVYNRATLRDIRSGIHFEKFLRLECVTKHVIGTGVSEMLLHRDGQMIQSTQQDGISSPIQIVLTWDSIVTDTRGRATVAVPVPPVPIWCQP